MEKGLLLIGGASRNVGKTTFSCNVIKQFAKNHPVIGLKIKTIYEGDSFFHGKDRNPLESDFRLIEEFDKDSDEDTGKMLRAGAERVFRLKVKSHALHDAFLYFKKQITTECVIVCESNSLRKVIEPDIFLLIKHKNEQNMKPSARELEKYTDKIIYTNKKKHDFKAEELEIINNKWMIK